MIRDHSLTPSISGTTYTVLQWHWPSTSTLLKKKFEHLIYGDHNYGARRAPRPPEGNHWHPEG